MSYPRVIIFAKFNSACVSQSRTFFVDNVAARNKIREGELARVVRLEAKIILYTYLLFIVIRSKRKLRCGIIIARYYEPMLSPSSPPVNSIVRWDGKCIGVGARKDAGLLRLDSPIFKWSFRFYFLFLVARNVCSFSSNAYRVLENFSSTKAAMTKTKSDYDKCASSSARCLPSWTHLKARIEWSRKIIL